MIGYLDMAQPPAIIRPVTVTHSSGLVIQPYYVVEAELTAYTSNAASGTADGMTSSGRLASRGTVAAPKQIPMYAKIVIPDYKELGLEIGEYTKLDHGSAIKIRTDGVYHFDIWLPSEEACRRFGRKKKVKVLIYGRPIE